MAKVSKQVQVSKETYELAQGLADIAIEAINASADGWQQEDFLKLVTPLVAKLPSMIDGADKIDDEMREDPFAFSAAFALAGMSAGRAIQDRAKKKSAPVVENNAPIEES